MLKQLRPLLIVAGILALLTAVLMLPVLRPPTGSEFLDGHDLVNQQYPLGSFMVVTAIGSICIGRHAA